MVKKTSKSKNFNLISPQEQLRFNFYKTYDVNLSLNKINNSNLFADFFSIDYLPFNDFNLNFTKGSK
jgi:hypothetical protein